MMQQSFNLEQVNYNIQSVKDTKTTVRASYIYCVSRVIILFLHSFFSGLFLLISLVPTFVWSFCHTKRNFVCRCAVKKLLTHSVTRVFY